MKSLISVASFISILSISIQLSSPVLTPQARSTATGDVGDKQRQNRGRGREGYGGLQAKCDALSQTLPRRGIQDGRRHGYSAWRDGKSGGRCT